jgi:hypothetical protein
MAGYLLACLVRLSQHDGTTDGISIGRARTTVDAFAEHSRDVNLTTDRRGCPWTPWTLRAPPSKPLVGILGDVDGRIVPVAPRQFLYSTRTGSSSDEVGLVDYGSGLAAADTDEDALVQPVEIGGGGLDLG